MRKILIEVLILVLALCLLVKMAAQLAPTASDGGSTLHIANSTNKFAWDLYKQLVSSKNDDNVFFSPASITMALGMTYMGARSRTAEQMMKVLHLQEVNKDHVPPSFGKVLTSLGESTEGFTLHTANKLYANSKFKIDDLYQDATKNHYKSETESYDFSEHGEDSRLKINKWVEDKTNNKIQNLLPEGSIDALTAVILVNAIYFKGDWQSKFEVENTENADFSVTASLTKSIPMMFQNHEFYFGYNNDLNAHAIKLPYVNERLNLFIVLPQYPQPNSSPLQLLQELEEHLTVGQMQNMHGEFGMSKMKVDLWLPKFKLDSGANLKNHLPKMGMTDLFDQQRADLSGIDASNNIFVSDVLHKAFIDVNEEGSEAAAATAVRMQMRSLPIVHEFRADHPFIFFLHDTTTGLILFMGRLVNPILATDSSHTEL